MMTTPSPSGAGWDAGYMSTVESNNSGDDSELNVSFIHSSVRWGLLHTYTLANHFPPFQAAYI